MSSLYSIGTDTELFGKDSNGIHIALCGKIGGTKEEPMQIRNLPVGFALQEDNVAVEFNIPPCSDSDRFDSFIGAVLQNTEAVLKKLGLTVSSEVAVSFGQRELLHPKAMVFGCEPDYNAWTGKENPRPVCDNLLLRTAGGHIHVGTDANMVNAVQMMDLYLGVPSIMLDTGGGSDQRRKLYGKAGAMRPKPYGFEYRVLSNWWALSSPLRKWVFNNTYRSIAHSDAGFITKTVGLKIQDCINNGDKKIAQFFINKFDIPMPVIPNAISPSI